MARASVLTSLALDRFAKVFGIAPTHFNGSDAGNIFPYSGRCNDVWYQYQWQSADRVSREELAREIAQAEDDVANLIGYYPAPRWFSGEVHRQPPFYRPESRYLLGADGRLKSIRLDNGLFVEPGVRALESVGTASVAGASLTYTDNDGDGFLETVTITLATTLTDACDIKVFHSGETDETWEIRPRRTSSISAGVLTMTFYSWQFIDPALYEEFPTEDGILPIDITTITAPNTTPDNLVTSVDVYREYADTTQASAQFYWEPCATGCGIDSCVACSSTCGCGTTGCEVCALTTQDGCIHVTNVNSSMVIAAPATYNATTAQWDAANFTYCREPDFVKVWYRAGDVSQDYLSGRTCDRLSDYWARLIGRLAIARLERPFCSCQNLAALETSLRQDLGLVSEGGPGSRFVHPGIQGSPFGTRRGEVEAWMQISKFLKKRNARVAIV